MLVKRGGVKQARLVFWLAAGLQDRTKSLRQRPSDRDKHTICKTRTAEVFMVGVWTGRAKTHLCFCQQRAEFSHSQMAGAGAVLICLSGAAKIDNYTPWCQKLVATHQLKWVSVTAAHPQQTKWDVEPTAVRSTRQRFFQINISSLHI